MINLEDINITIKELESGNTTFDSCTKLAALYTVRRELNGVEPNAVTQEVQDILPQYKKYCKVKRQYQLDEIGEPVMFDAMQNVCKEITEFIHTLYNNTDTSVERALITNMLQQLSSALSIS